MTYAVIRKLLERQLNAVSSEFPTAFENVRFSPVHGTPYQAAYLLPGATANPTYGDDFKREVGIFQVSLMYPSNAGSGAAQTRAEVIKAAFKRGLTLSEGNDRVLINASPYQSPGRLDGAWYTLTVSVPYYVDISP